LRSIDRYDAIAMHTPEFAAAARPGTLVAITRWGAVGSVLGLIVLSLAWELWLVPSHAGGIVAAVKALPLCIPLGGLLRRRMYTYRWVSLMVWIYFIEGVVRAFSDRGLSAQLALVEVVLCLTLFASCVTHVKARLTQAKASA
jgi:uncharacterized membrane protein